MVLICEAWHTDSADMTVVRVASTCIWCTLTLLWWYAIHPQWFRDCPGPVLKPAPRPEPWCVSYNKKLNKEVAKADANKVRASLAFQALPIV